MFQPDIVVRASDRPEVRLVVEVKLDERQADRDRAQLKHYMRATSAPLGLLVTPRVTYVFKETYRDDPDSIHEIARVDTRALVRSRSTANNERELEADVRAWLDTMVRQPGVPQHRGDKQLEQVEDYLLPAMVDAEIGAVGLL